MADQEAMDRELREMLGIIEPSDSPWACGYGTKDEQKVDVFLCGLQATE